MITEITPLFTIQAADVDKNFPTMVKIIKFL